MKKIFSIAAIAAAFIFSSCSEEKPLDLNVMTFNIRYDNPEDSLNNWLYRKDVAAELIKQQDCDLVGAQEVLHNQLEDMKTRLPEYTFIGVGREDGATEGEYGPIMYKTAKFTELNSGYFWLSETPEVAGSKGWDGACERIATWALLQDKETKKEVFFINTHLDHVGKIARQEGVTLLLDRAIELGKGSPIVMTGDFNAEPESSVIKHVTNKEAKNHLVHTKDVATEVNGTNWTFHDFDKIPGEYRPFIDYIFVSEGIVVNKHTVLPMRLGEQLISDHSQVVANISIK